MLGILEEVNDFGNLDLSLGESCHILEGYLAIVVLVKKARLGFADIENAATGTTGSTHSPQQEEPQCHEQHDGAEGVKNHREVIPALDILHLARENALLAPGLDIIVKFVGAGNLGRHLVGRCRGSRAKGAGRRLGRLVLEDLAGQGVGQQSLGLIFTAIDSNGFNATLADDILEAGPVHLLGDAPILVHPQHGEEEQDDESVHPKDVELGCLALIIVCHYYSLLLSTKSIQVRNGIDACVGPQLFQVVALTELGHEDVDEGVAVVDDDPLGVLVTVVVERTLPSIFLDILAHTVGNSGHLHGRIARCDDKTLSCGSFNTRQVHMDNVVSFLFLNCFDDRFDQFFVFVHTI